MKFEIYRNTTERRFGVAKLPVRQTLIWFGPVFVRFNR